MEAAGIEPARDSAPKVRVSSGFQADFDLGTGIRVTVEREKIGLELGGRHAFLDLEEALPQLERIVEIARYLYYSDDTQEVSRAA